MTYNAPYFTVTAGDCVTAGRGGHHPHMGRVRASFRKAFLKKRGVVGGPIW